MEAMKAVTKKECGLNTWCQMSVLFFSLKDQSNLEFLNFVCGPVQQEVAKGIAVGADTDTADVAEFSIFKDIKSNEGQSRRKMYC